MPVKEVLFVDFALAHQPIADEPAYVPPPAVRRLSAADLDEPAAIEASAPVTDDQRKHMFALWNELGYGGDANRDTRLALTARFIGAESIASSNDLTRDQAHTVILKLIERKTAMATEAGEPR